MPHNTNTFARIDIDTLTITHFNEFKRAESLNFYQLILKQALTDSFKKQTDKILGILFGEPGPLRHACS